jgi:hypothetical protein
MKYRPPDPFEPAKAFWAWNAMSWPVPVVDVACEKMNPPLVGAITNDVPVPLITIGPPVDAEEYESDDTY